MDFYTLQIIKPVVEATKDQSVWLQYLSGLTTPVLAAFGIWIAWSQWKTARMKLKLDLFDKRIVVYEAVRKAIGNLGNFDYSISDLRNDYLNGIAGARWLFDEEMAQFLSVQVLDELGILRKAIEDQHDAVPSSLIEGLQSRLASLGDVVSLSNNIEARFAPFLSVAH